MIGQTISHYKILEHLGGGGMGVVYKAEDTHLKRLVALKFLPADLTRDHHARERLIQEARAASMLDHENICSVHEIGVHDGQTFIVMGYYEGETLKSKIEKGPVPTLEALDIILQIAKGLAKAHEAGIIHRDIKPANIILTKDGVAKILDFGLARSLQATLTTVPARTPGTIAYMSPEQARGESVDARTDIWSLGVILYEMLTGKRPFQGDIEPVVIYAIATATPALPSTLVKGLRPGTDELVTRALRKKKETRYATVGDLIEDVRRVQEGKWQSEFTHRRPSRRVLLASAALLAVLGIAAFKYIGWFSSAPVSMPRQRVLIGKFRNLAGDSAYSYLGAVAGNLLIERLQQCRYVQVLPREAVLALVNSAGHAEDVDVGPDLGFQLCASEHVPYLVAGSLSRSGSVIMVDAQVFEAPARRLIGTVRTRGDGVASLMDQQIGVLSKQILFMLGVASEIQGNTSIVRSASETQSVEAYWCCMRSQDALARRVPRQQLYWSERAVELDSTWALPRMLTWNALMRYDERAKSDAAIRTAMRLAEHADKRTRYWIALCYAAGIEKDLEKRFRVADAWTRDFPEDPYAWWEKSAGASDLGQVDSALAFAHQAIAVGGASPDIYDRIAWYHLEQGNVPSARRALEQYQSLRPDEGAPYISFGDFLYHIGRVEEAMSFYERALSLEPEIIEAPGSLAYCKVLQEKYQEAEVLMGGIIANGTESKSRARLWLAFLKAWCGELNVADAEARKIVAEAAKLESPALRQTSLMLRSWIALHRGDVVSASELADQWYSDGPANPLKEAYVAILHLTAGRRDSATAHSEMLRKLADLTKDSLRHLYRVNLHRLLSAEILLKGDLRSEAAASADTVFFRQPQPDLTALLGNLISAEIGDVGARAAAASGNSEKAITSYNRLLATPPASSVWIWPPYHYRLGKLLESAGRYNDAIAQYTRFVDIWGKADRPNRELDDASRRLVGLQRSARFHTGVHSP